MKVLYKGDFGLVGPACFCASGNVFKVQGSSGTVVVGGGGGGFRPLHPPPPKKKDYIKKKTVKEHTSS